jgi:hypothetical protein
MFKRYWTPWARIRSRERRRGWLPLPAELGRVGMWRGSGRPGMSVWPLSATYPSCDRFSRTRGRRTPAHLPSTGSGRGSRRTFRPFAGDPLLDHAAAEIRIKILPISLRGPLPWPQLARGRVRRGCRNKRKVGHRPGPYWWCSGDAILLTGAASPMRAAIHRTADRGRRARSRQLARGRPRRGSQGRRAPRTAPDVAGPVGTLTGAERNGRPVAHVEVPRG